jgi:hypothetical protein
MNDYIKQQAGIFYETFWRNPSEPAWIVLSPEEQMRWSELWLQAAEYFQKENETEGRDWWE